MLGTATRLLIGEFFRGLERTTSPQAARAPQEPLWRRLWRRVWPR
jgi:hypothetical protein